MQYGINIKNGYNVKEEKEKKSNDNYMFFGQGPMAQNENTQKMFYGDYECDDEPEEEEES